MNTRTRIPAVTPDMKTGTTHADSQDNSLSSMDLSIELSTEQTLEELRDSLNAKVSHDVNDPHFKKYTADAAFMEEQMLVRIAESTDPAAEKVVLVSNNGTPQRFVRGHWVITKRKFVEVLARAKPFGVTTPEIFDGNGNRTTKIEVHHGAGYNFEVQDRNPVGRAWLNDVMSQP